MFLSGFVKSQITNYISNGSFENHYNCSADLREAKFWSSIDSTNSGLYLNVCNGYIPNNSNTVYQLAKTGVAFGATTFYNTNISSNSRKYFKNRIA